MSEEPKSITITLEEWKARYDSYKQYRGQYLTTLSIVATGWVIAFGIAGNDRMPNWGRALILALLVVFVAGLVAAHVIARRAIRELGQRIERLENELGIVAFDTTRPLDVALKVTLAASVLLMAATLWALVYSLRHWS